MNPPHKNLRVLPIPSHCHHRNIWTFFCCISVLHSSFLRLLYRRKHWGNMLVPLMSMK